MTREQINTMQTQLSEMARTIQLMQETLQTAVPTDSQAFTQNNQPSVPLGTNAGGTTGEQRDEKLAE